MSERYFHKSLRHKNIDYRRGRFFVTMQVAHNTSLLGVIVGEKVVLNELERGVQEVLELMPLKYPEFELGEYVVMPNHIHMIVDIKLRLSNKENHLGFLMGRFKGAAAFVYGKMKRMGKVPDIGEHLWQRDYWENLISSEEEFRHYVQYIRYNPKNWTRDRWGAVTQYMLGEESLLNCPKRAFVASQGHAIRDFVPRRVEFSGCGTSVPLPPDTVLISTFTSAQEREVFRRALAKKRRIIHVCPQGIPREDELTTEQQQALDERRLLFISPHPSGSGLNKKVATWCNEYVLRQAAEIWVGDITPNGMLATLIDGLQREARA
ncbi:MAG: transposase [Akkermansia sp.]|nr:transposase [Akkermansia sp.]